MRRLQSLKPERPDEFFAQLKKGRIARVPGTAVFFSRFETPIPPVMIRHVAQMRALAGDGDRLTVKFEEYPRVALGQARRGRKGRRGIVARHRAFRLRRGPNVTAALACAKEKGCPIDLDDAVYFASHDDVVRSANPPRLPAWRRMLFAVMYRNAVRTPDRFDLPADTFLEVGRQIAL